MTPQTLDILLTSDRHSGQWLTPVATSTLTPAHLQVERSDASNFVECLVYSREKAVVMTGNLVDCCEPGKLNEIGLWYKPWFFKHAQAFFDTGPRTEYIPLRQYYHR